MGGEFKAKGVNVALGPVIGPLGRLAKGGRNWEGRITLRYFHCPTVNECRVLQRPISCGIIGSCDYQGH